MAYCSTATMYFAFGALVYLLTCALYLLASRGLGSPFRDSLTPAQLELKAASMQQRSAVFMGSLLVSALVVFMLRPFKGSCHAEQQTYVLAPSQY